MTSRTDKTSLDVGRWTLDVERCSGASTRRAFTIVELMISIAMVVILLVGIHQVFKMSSDTVGVGNTLADYARANRSAHGIFSGDYERLMKNAPLFILRSGVAGDPPNSKWGAFTS